MSGKFVISLDFELHWGVFDALTLEAYLNNLKNVKNVIEKLLVLSDKYEVKLTFATVGLLFAENKSEILKYLPKNIPNYIDKKLNPFQLLESIGENEEEDELHYAKSLIKTIKKNTNHEISTHTFGHYNCTAEGQTPQDFDSDLKSALAIAETMDIELKGIVFPKNQVDNDYLHVCYDNGITNYRGTENHYLYRPKNFNAKIKKAFRLIDNYINISGYHTYSVEKLGPNKIGLVNIPSSRFLRPYLPKLSFLEKYKVKRITNAMKHAALNNELFHLWWHPHNFGANLNENLENLEEIFKTYKRLKESHEFESITMTDLANKVCIQ